MEKTAYPRQLFRCLFWSSIVGLGLLGPSCFAQDVTTALPSDQAAFLISAGKHNGLVGNDEQPWHSRSSFKIFDEQGNLKDQGTYEKFWADVREIKETYTSNGYSQTVYNTHQGSLQTNTQPWPSDLIRYAEAFTHLVPTSATQIANFDISAEVRTIDSIGYRCISMKTRQPLTNAANQVDATFCFDAGSDTFRMALYPLTHTVMRCTSQMAFRGHSLCSDFSLERDGKLAFTSHVESIESWAVLDDSIFDPPPSATPLPSEIKNTVPNLKAVDGKVTVPSNIGMTLNFRKFEPVYPPIDKYEGVQGTVALRVTIGKDGTVENLQVISGPNLLQQAAMDTVRRWIYRPALLNGVPVEVETTVNVVFQLRPTTPPSIPRKIDISAGVAEEILTHRVHPVYPPEAKAAGISGTVVILVAISDQGAIEDLHVVSGPASLQEAALEAVKQWKYRPYLLNNAPVAVETTVNVNFTLPN